MRTQPICKTQVVQFLLGCLLETSKRSVDLIEATKPEPKLSSEPAGKKLLKQVGAALLAVLFIWLSFRGANLEQVWKYAKESDWSYLALTFLSGLLSHLLRAVRWLLLLKPLSPKKISLWNAFSAIIYGYVANLIVPRGGELVRLVSFTTTEKLPMAGVLSTLLIDRLLDVVLLMLLLGSTLTILPASITSSMPWLLPGGASLSILTLIALVALPFLGRIAAYMVTLKPIARFIPESLSGRLQELINQFNEGTKSLTNPVVYPAIAGLSLIIWFLYWLNFYLVLKAFHLDQQVTLLDSFIVFAVGSVGVLIPTPGSIGSFHFLVSQALILTSNVSKDMALSFVSTLHAMSFALVPCPVALFCLIVNLTLKKTRTAPEN